MDFQLSQLTIALPEIFLLGLVSVVLLADVFVGKRFRSLSHGLTLAGLVVVFLLTLLQFKSYPEPVMAFSGHYVLDKLAILSKLFIYLFGFIAFIYARDFNRSQHIPSGDYHLLGLFSVLGMSIMVSAQTFLTVYLGLELLSLSLYAMVAMNKESLISSEAAMKYFILGSFASGMLLYGISLLFGLTGSVELDTVGRILQTQQNMVPLVALVFMLSGLVFKLGAVPFHMWVPDVYQGASTPTTLFIASAPKIAAFAVVIRILNEAVPTLHVNWEEMLIVISILSMGMGNILAIAQTNLKRMFAYSSIAHMGYALLGVIAGPHVAHGYSAAMFYIVTYVLVAAGGFAIITIMSHDGIEFDKLEDYRGLNARNPWLAFLMLLLLFSMAGVPPTVGFIAKFGLLEALVQGGMVWLAVLALVFALIGAYYYLRVVKVMYFEEPSERLLAEPIVISTPMLAVVSMNGAAALLLGLLPSFLIELCRVTVG